VAIVSGGGTGGGGGGDASAANQSAGLARQGALDDAPVTDPAAAATQIAAAKGVLVLAGARAEEAPGSDTAPSGLNGRLQRIAQRLTTLIAALGNPFQSGDSIGNTGFAINGTLPAFASTPTFNLGSLNGAATAAKQDATIAALGSPFQAGGSIGNTGFAINGTLPAFASTPTFNLGSLNGAATANAQTTGNNSLASIDGKLAPLEGGRAPVATQKLATTSRTYNFGDSQRLTTSGPGPVRSTALAATEVTLVSSVRGFFRVGDSSVNASVGAGSFPIPADVPFTLQITSGQFISFIRDGATDGSLSIMLVA
jgi:hypothetical protein